jgi:hypothetical protein
VLLVIEADLGAGLGGSFDDCFHVAGIRVVARPAAGRVRPRVTPALLRAEMAAVAAQAGRGPRRAAGQADQVREVRKPCLVPLCAGTQDDGREQRDQERPSER